MNGTVRLLLVLGGLAAACWYLGGPYRDALNDVGHQMRRAATFGMRLDPTEVSPNVEDRRGQHRGNITIPGDLPTQAGRDDIPQQRREERQADGRVIVGCWDGRQMLPPSFCDGSGIATTGQAAAAGETPLDDCDGTRDRNSRGHVCGPIDVFGFRKRGW
jgi:hypothetical protein